MSKSPRPYSLSSNIFVLPLTHMLRYWLGEINVWAGWNSSVFNLLKNKVQEFTVKDKVCGMAFDAMSLNSGFYYSTGRDRLGVVDLGQYGSTDKPAQYAVVFMVRGLAWK